MELDPIGLAGTALLLLTTAGGAWRLIAVSIARVRDDLSAYKLHVAETYVTKKGLQEQTAQIMSAIRSVADSVEQLNQRIDRLLEKRV